MKLTFGIFTSTVPLDKIKESPLDDMPGADEDYNVPVVANSESISLGAEVQFDDC